MRGTSSGDPAVLHTERLLPSASVWLAAALLAGLSTLMAVPLGPTAVTIAAVLAVVGIVVALVAWSPPVQVVDGELIAGRAHIPVHLIGEITPLDAVQTRQELGPRLDARAFLCIRGWVRTSVRADLIDPDDPTPYWIVSSQRPRALAAAVERARAETGPAG